MSELDGTINVNDALLRVASINNELSYIEADRITSILIGLAIIIIIGGMLLWMISTTICDCTGFDNVKAHIIIDVSIIIIACVVAICIINMEYEAKKDGLLVEKEMLETYLRSKGYL